MEVVVNILQEKRVPFPLLGLLIYRLRLQKIPHIDVFCFFLEEMYPRDIPCTEETCEDIVNQIFSLRGATVSYVQVFTSREYSLSVQEEYDYMFDIIFSLFTEMCTDGVEAFMIAREARAFYTLKCA